MAKDIKKEQAKVMKKRRKDKERRKKLIQLSSPMAVLKRVRQFPIKECWITADWETELKTQGFVQITVTRQQPNGALTFGSYLVDTFLLGLKDTFARVDVSLVEFRQFIEQAYISTDQDVEPCTAELAHQLIYGAIDYAAQFNFKPDKDWRESQLVLEPRDTLATPYDLKFGKDGKPCFVAGPFDNIKAVMAKLEKNPGAGNYDYLIPMGDHFVPKALVDEVLQKIETGELDGLVAEMDDDDDEDGI